MRQTREHENGFFEILMFLAKEEVRNMKISQLIVLRKKIFNYERLNYNVEENFFVNEIRKSLIKTVEETLLELEKIK